jgi:hypothetical protein
MKLLHDVQDFLRLDEPREEKKKRRVKKREKKAEAEEKQTPRSGKERAPAPRVASAFPAPLPSSASPAPLERPLTVASAPLAPIAAPLPKKRTKRAEPGKAPRTYKPKNIVPSESYTPELGDRFEIVMPDLRPFDAVVVGMAGGKARVAMADPGKEPREYPAIEMPSESVAHFANDLRGMVRGAATSDDPAVNSVLRGEATWLGKGNDGIAFRIGDEVVKVSTTVPYQPFNAGHMTPEGAAVRMKSQHEASEALHAAGVGAILPTRYVKHGDKAFLVKPYVEIPPKFTREQLDEIAQSIEAMHERGWVMRDEIQPGLWRGKAYHYDTGLAEYVGTKKTDPDDYWSEANSDISNLRRVFEASGEKYLTRKERVNPIAAFEEIARRPTYNASREELKERKKESFRKFMEVKRYIRNHPGEDLGFWSEIPEYAKEELDDLHARLDRAMVMAKE